MAKRRSAVRTTVRAPVRPDLDLARLAPSARSLAVGFGLAALAAGSYACARWTPLFAVRSIEVAGADRTTSAHVSAALADLKGVSLVGLRADDVQLRIAALPDVVSVRYDRAFPNTLVVFVRAERPVAVVRRGDRSWLVSARGRVISRLTLGDRPRLPRIWVGPTVAIARGALLTDSDTLRAVRTLALRGIRALPPVRAARVDGRDVTLVLRSRLEVRLGHEDALPLKLAIAARVLPRMATSSAGESLYLDVSVPERPVAGPI